MGDNPYASENAVKNLERLKNVTLMDPLTPIKDDIANNKKSIQNNFTLIKDVHNDTIKLEQDIEQFGKHLRQLRTFTYINLVIASISLILTILISVR
jgi:hypothetical protein